MFSGFVATIRMICSGPRRSAGFISGLQKWKLLGLKNKRTLTKKEKHHQHKPSQCAHDGSSRLSEKLMCPFINPNKQVNSEALDQCIEEPLCFEFEKTHGIDGSRLYLQKFPSVTTVLQQTKPANEFFALRNWQKAQIIEHGEEQFKKMAETITRRGSDFHQDMHVYLTKLKTHDTLTEHINPSPHWESVQHVLEDLQDIVAVESAVIHPILGYAGTLDLVAQYNGTLCVIDWKTSQKRKSKLEDCYSYPHQIAAYAGAVNYSDIYPFQVHHGMIVIAYKNGDPADVVMMSPEICKEYWELWLERLEEYKLRFPDVESCDQAFGMKDTNIVRERGDQVLNEMTAHALRPPTVHNIGTPLKHLGTVLHDVDFIHERTLWEQTKELSSSLVSARSWAKWTAYLMGLLKKERQS